MATRAVFVLSVALTYVSGWLVIPQRTKLLRSYNVSGDDFETVTDDEKVILDVYYETLNPECKQEYISLQGIYDKIGDQLDIKTYPYGNAYTSGNTVICQHGEAECYGNKLHACATDILKDIAKWLKYNACMMAQDSTDDAADKCGADQKIDSQPIKDCAKGKRGQELLIQYGKMTPANHQYVPWILINGKLADYGWDLFVALCEAFKNPPENCKQRDVTAAEKVKLDVYYETLCPGCKKEWTLLPGVYDKIGDHLDLNTYPYGNAQTSGNTVNCQHGEAECYGNKLHACATDILKDIAKWLKYNACMMAQDSTDNAADKCGADQKIDSQPIKDCAKGQRGQDLLIEYGKKTPADHQYMPWVLINGKLVNYDEDLFVTLCEAFKNPPENCKQRDVTADEKVKLDVYYETMSAACRITWRVLPGIYDEIGDHLDFNTYPYGNAQTSGNTVICNHGEAECYGNKLHACATDILKDITKWFKYNACMMDQDSTDDAADKCGADQKIDSQPIKDCAKGQRGQDLLIEYGKKTPTNYQYMPWILVNGEHVFFGKNLFVILCKAFKNPPKNCKQLDVCKN